MFDKYLASSGKNGIDVYHETYYRCYVCCIKLGRALPRMDDNGDAYVDSVITCGRIECAKEYPIPQTEWYGRSEYNVKDWK